jgi:two-component system sensor kinase FixL
LRAGRIVRRLRELVARGASALRHENLARLIADAGVLAFLDAHLLGIRHEIEIDPDACWVEADRIQIQQVLINLIRNAVQAMQSQPLREIRVRARRTSPEQVEISVADSGTGIADEVRDALFSPFQGTKKDGLGIGLSISRTIVEAHGGKIWAEAGEERGTVFRFTLPAGEDPGAEI